MFKNFLKSEKGFSLAEVMVAAGMLGALSLAVMQLTKNMSGSTKALEASSEALTVTNAIKTTLLGEGACKNTLENVNISGNTTITEIKDINDATRYSVGSVYGTRAVRLTGMRLQERSTTLSGGARTGTVKLFIDFEKLNKQITGPKTVTKEIMLNVMTNTVHVIQNCFNSENAARSASCADVGGTFNAVTLRCDLQAYNTIASLSTNDHEAVSENQLKQIMTELMAYNEIRYLNQTTESLNDSANVTTIGNSAAGDTITINGRLQTSGILYSNNHLYIASGYYLRMSSDRSLKKEIEPLKDVLKDLDKISGVSFKWKHNNEKDIGVIAQELQSVFPTLVSKNPETGKLTVNYSALGAISIQAVKELKKENAKLKQDLLEITAHICKNSKDATFCKKGKKKATKKNLKKVKVKK